MMKIADASLSLSPAGDAHGAPAETWPLGDTIAATVTHCACDDKVIRAVRAYLREHFPHYAVRDFHERARLVRTGLPTQYAEYHVVSVTDWEKAYYTIVSMEFLAQPVDQIGEHLWRYDLASMLQHHRVVIAFDKCISPL
jgi:hypothetical protein